MAATTIGEGWALGELGGQDGVCWCSPDTTEWVGSICPPLLEDFASSSAECPSTQESTSLVSGQVVNGDDSASSDDDDQGSVEPHREEDAESLLCELDSDDNGLEYD